MADSVQNMGKTFMCALAECMSGQNAARAYDDMSKEKIFSTGSLKVPRK